MKLLLHLSLLTFLLGVSTIAKADKVIIDLSEQGYTNAQDVDTIVKNGVTLAFGKHKGSYVPKYYDEGSAVRLYAGNTLKVSHQDHITSITMTFVGGSKYYPSSTDFDVDSGTATLGSTTIWEGAAHDVVFTNTASKGHWRLRKIIIETTHIQEMLPEVTSLADLRALDNGTHIRLTLGRDNPGQIEYVHNGTSTDAFVRDNEMAVDFKNFLPDDAGWHTNAGGALVGSVDGEYRMNNGMPEFTHISSSIADSILCLDNWHAPTPILVDDLSILADTTHRADYIVVENATLDVTEEGTYFMEYNEQQLGISNHFGINGLIPEELQGREFAVYGILGASDDGSTSMLYGTHIEEIIPNIALGETLYTNTNTIGTYNNRMVNIQVDRKLVTDVWNTICLPFDISDFSDIVSSAKLAVFTGYNATDNSLEFTSVNDLKAGLPYLVNPSEDVERIVIQGANIESGLSPISYGAYDMVGIFDPTTLYAGDTNVLFLGEGNTLYYPNVTNDLKGFRAYFRTTGPATEANICIDGVMSGITTATLDGMSNDGPIYNIGGQMVGTSVDRLQKGVYVRAGNKVIVK